MDMDAKTWGEKRSCISWEQIMLVCHCNTCLIQLHELVQQDAIHRTQAFAFLPETWRGSSGQRPPSASGRIYIWASDQTSWHINLCSAVRNSVHVSQCTCLPAHLSFISLVSPALPPVSPANQHLVSLHLILPTWGSPPRLSTCTSFPHQFSLDFGPVLSWVFCFVRPSPSFCVKRFNKYSILQRLISLINIVWTLWWKVPQSKAKQHQHRFQSAQNSPIIWMEFAFYFLPHLLFSVSWYTSPPGCSFFNSLQLANCSGNSETAVSKRL